jgi:hypothetical protein
MILVSLDYTPSPMMLVALNYVLPLVILVFFGYTPSFVMSASLNYASAAVFEILDTV